MMSHLKQLEAEAMKELAAIRSKMKWTERRDLRNKVIFIALGVAVMVWAIWERKNVRFVIPRALSAIWTVIYYIGGKKLILNT